MLSVPVQGRSAYVSRVSSRVRCTLARRLRRMVRLATTFSGLSRRSLGISTKGSPSRIGTARSAVSCGSALAFSASITAIATGADLAKGNSRCAEASSTASLAMAGATTVWSRDASPEVAVPSISV